MTELLSAKSRVTEPENRLGILETHHQDKLKKQHEEIFDKLFAVVDLYRRSMLYEVQLLCGPLDLWVIDLG